MVGVYGHTGDSGPAAYNLKLPAAADVARFALDRRRRHGEERTLAGVDTHSRSNGKSRASSSLRQRPLRTELPRATRPASPRG